MWPWSKHKKRDEQFFLDAMRAAAEGDRISNLKESLATLGVNVISEREPTQLVADGAVALLDHVRNRANTTASEDAVEFVDGILLMVFSNHLSCVLRCNFEFSSTIALVVHFSVDPPEDWDDLPSVVSDAIQYYNEMSQMDSNVIRAAGNACVKWCGKPNSDNLDSLAELYAVLVKSVR
jgi:hypothetical protein